MIARSLTALAALATLSFSTVAVAGEAHVTIPFASTGGIDEWHADTDSSLYLRSRSREWYKAELLGPCSGLSFATTIGYVTPANGSFDDTSSIVVDGQKCKVTKLEHSAAPPKKK